MRTFSILFSKADKKFIFSGRPSCLLHSIQIAASRKISDVAPLAKIRLNLFLMESDAYTAVGEVLYPTGTNG